LKLGLVAADWGNTEHEERVRAAGFALDLEDWR
jgi:hypothetical protein